MTLPAMRWRRFQCAAATEIPRASLPVVTTALAVPLSRCYCRRVLYCVHDQPERDGVKSTVWDLCFSPGAWRLAGARGCVLTRDSLPPSVCPLTDAAERHRSPELRVVAASMCSCIARHKVSMLRWSSGHRERR